MKSDLNLERFAEEFDRFKRLIAINDEGRPFTNFNEGLAADWEGYKSRLRDRALAILSFDSWSATSIGSGTILNKLISAIEINDKRAGIRNNLVFWENRYGHANRDHRILLDAADDTKLTKEIETHLFNLYFDRNSDESSFNAINEIIGRRYPLIAYLFFLKDIDHFMPIRTTTFDRVFGSLGINLRTRGNCSWANYLSFNEALEDIRDSLVSIANISDVRLVDAHSFCWLLGRLEHTETEAAPRKSRDAGRFLHSWEKQIALMRFGVEQTVKRSNGQIVQTTLKNKELRMGGTAFEAHLSWLLEKQERKCALTGISLQKDEIGSDPNFIASVDRINSDGHYEKGNIQLVCRFINFWKRDQDNEEFKRLLMAVRREEIMY
jgi:hypothetical protein